MKIQEQMIENPITIEPNATVGEAIELMKANSIRHLPVVTKGKKLYGFLTLADLKQGLIPSMVSDISLDDLIIKAPIMVSPDDDIEFAAQLIYKHKIGGMPVVKGDRLVGIITASDILRTFIDMMGILAATSRIDVILPDQAGAFKKAMQIIHDNGGDIINVSMTPQHGGERIYYFRLSACKTHEIKTALENADLEVLAAMD
ncbi:MAG: CBS domain-containing protein [Desulfobacterales bacterium]|jgi:acetoin utilization protein AcuB